LSTHISKVPQGRSNAACGFPEPVLAPFKMRYKFTILNSYRGFQVQALHNCRQVQIMDLAKLPRT